MKNMTSLGSTYDKQKIEPKQAHSPMSNEGNNSFFALE
jgi:hypothetical protein